MTIAADLLQKHIKTLVDENAQWQTLIADDILWELAYAPALGHPARLSGREEVVRHATWFVGASGEFSFLRHQGISPCRSGRRSRRSQRGWDHQSYTAHLPAGLCDLPACSSWQDCVPTRIFRSSACGQGAERADPRSLERPWYPPLRAESEAITRLDTYSCSPLAGPLCRKMLPGTQGNSTPIRSRDTSPVSVD
jgi:hypothetical protein